jgi:hypothetical protein
MGGWRSLTVDPGTFSVFDGLMVEAPTTEAKIVPSRDHGHVIDRSLSPMASVRADARYAECRPDAFV